MRVLELGKTVHRTVGKLSSVKMIGMLSIEWMLSFVGCRGPGAVAGGVGG